MENKRERMIMMSGVGKKVVPFFCFSGGAKALKEITFLVEAFK